MNSAFGIDHGEISKASKRINHLFKYGYKQGEHKFSPGAKAHRAKMLSSLKDSTGRQTAMQRTMKGVQEKGVVQGGRTTWTNVFPKPRKPGDQW